jgi:2Fe-2S ferredoxin
MTSITLAITDATGELTMLSVPANGQNLMEVARARGVPGIIGDCGGGCACATCHVHVSPDWFEKVGPPNDVEADMLDMAEDLVPTSRLSCQIHLTPDLDGLAVTVASAG